MLERGATQLRCAGGEEKTMLERCARLGSVALPLRRAGGEEKTMLGARLGTAASARRR